MYYDVCLKFEDEFAAITALFTRMEHLENGGTKVELVPKYAAVDIIGVITKSSGKVVKTVDGEIPELLPIPGWHANVRHTAEMPELSAWVVVPKTPNRVWA